MTEFIADFNKQHRQHSYRLLEPIDAGGQGDVYKGFRLSEPEDLVALKFYPPLHDGQTNEQFVSEARRLHTLRHPNIVEVKWHGTYTPSLRRNRLWNAALENPKVRPYLVMEYVEGGTLRDQIEDNPFLPSAQVVSYTAQIIDAMRYAHGETRSSESGEKIVHRDLKPANILIDSNRQPDKIEGFPDIQQYGFVKVADFGAAAPGHTNLNTVTVTQDAIGTMPYMAPEQFTNAVFASDVYALAVMAYEQLSGRRPIVPLHGRDDVAAWFMAHTQQAVLPLEEVCPSMNPLIEHIQIPILRALAKQVSDRYVSMGAFGDDFANSVRLGMAAWKRQPTFIDMSTVKITPPDTSETPTTAFDTHQIVHTPRIEQGPSAFDISEQSSLLTRRSVLRAGMGIMGLALTGGVVAADHAPEYMSEKLSPTERKERELQSSIKIASEILAKLEAKGYATKAASIMKYLLPYQPDSIATKIKALPVTIGYGHEVWLAADVARYNTDLAIKIMDEYKRKDLDNLIVIGTAVAAVANMPGHPSNAVAKRAVEKEIAYYVDARLDSVADPLAAALSPTSAFKTASYKSGKTAKDVMDSLVQKDETYTIEALGKAIVEHNPAVVISVVQHYTAKNSSSDVYISDNEQRLIVELCKTIAPHDNTTAGQIFASIEHRLSNDIATDLAIHLAPYTPEALRSFAKNRSGSNLHGLTAVAVAASTTGSKLFEEISQKDHLVSAWASVAHDPLNDKQNAAALDILYQDENFMKYHAANFAIALLISRST